MRQDALPEVRPGLILSGPKHDVRPHRICQRIYGLCRRGRPRIGVNLHSTEVVPKSRFHERARRLVERSPRRTQNLVDNGRRGGRPGSCGRTALQGRFLFLAFLALLAAAGVLTAGALPL
jgi:hypothetical protein